MKSIIGFLKVVLMFGGVVFYAGLGLVFVVGWSVGSAFNKAANVPYGDVSAYSSKNIPITTTVAEKPVDAATQASDVPTHQTPRVSIDSVAYRVVEKNSAFWYLSWKVTFHNNSDKTVEVYFDAKYNDKDGFPVDEHPNSLIIGAKSSKTHTRKIAVEAQFAKNIVEIQVEVTSIN